MQFDQLITPRLILRKLTPEAYGYLYTNFDDSYLMEFLGMDADGLNQEKEKYRQGLTSYNRTQMNF